MSPLLSTQFMYRKQLCLSLTEDLKLAWYINNVMLTGPIQPQVSGIPDVVVRHKHMKNEGEYRVSHLRDVFVGSRSK